MLGKKQKQERGGAGPHTECEESLVEIFDIHAPPAAEELPERRPRRVLRHDPRN